MNDGPRWKVPRNHDDATSLSSGPRRCHIVVVAFAARGAGGTRGVPRPGALALAGVEDLAGVEGAAHRGLQREGARIEFPAHAVPFQDADAVLAGHRAAQGDGRVEELLE